MLVVSHFVKPVTRLDVGVKTTLQKYGVALFAAVTLKVVLLVVLVAGEVAPLSVIG
jgi:hypothetical protein